MANKKLWVARDKRRSFNSNLWLYTRKPRRHKKDGKFYIPGETECLEIPEHLFPGVTWENSPKELKNVLGYSNRLQAYDIS